MLLPTCWTAQREIILRIQWRNWSQVQVQIKGDAISVTREHASIEQEILKLYYKQEKKKKKLNFKDFGYCSLL